MPRPGRFTPRKKTRYPLYLRLRGIQGRSGRVLKFSPLPGIDLRTFQPVAIRYTDYAIAAAVYIRILKLTLYKKTLDSTRSKPRQFFQRLAVICERYQRRRLPIDYFDECLCVCFRQCLGLIFFFICPRYRGELSYLAPLGSENISAPYFKQCFFRGGWITPQTESNTTPPSPKTEITNILFYILNLWLRIYCSGLRGCDTREKEIVI